MNTKVKPSDSQSPLKLKKRSNLLALEQRFMFDAAAGDAAHEALPLPLQETTKAPSASLLAAERQAVQNVTRYLQQTTDNELFKTFSADETTPSAEWTERLSQLRASFATGSFQPQLVAMDNASDLGAVAAFSAHGPEGGPTLFFSQFWLNVLDNESIVQILTEELGHALDAALNAGKDTPGDEGQKFAALVGGRDTSESALDNDAGWVTSGGKTFEVEFASLKFVNAYAMVYDLNNNGVIDSPTETPAAKEQNLHNFNYSNPLGDVRIDDNSAGQMFSGNDVSATAIVIAGNTYYGWISRPIKSNGDVKGFYFWTDPQFTTFTLAQSDGNADGDSNALDNRGFVLVVDQAYFDGLATQTVGTDIDNVAGLRTYKQVGSSSDRVDAALNALVTTNNAPVANNDSAIALEAGGLSNASPGTNPAGNVLTNDTDADAGDTKIVTKVGTASATLAVAATSTSANGTQVTGLYGVLTLGANGTYVYAVTNSSDAVQALRTSSNTLTDTFTYQMVDSKGVASTAKITITVQGANDTPIAANDYNTAKSTLSSVSAANQYTSSDAFGSLATGNVLNNDSDVDKYAETKSVVGTTATGTYSSYNAGGTSTSLTFASTQGNSLNAVGVGDYAYTPEISANKYYVLKASDGSNITISSKVLNANGTYSIGLSATPTKYNNGTSDVAFTATNGSLIDFASSLNNGGKPSGIKEATISASTATNYATVTVTVTDGYVNVGMAVTGTNIPANAVVTAISTSGALTTVTIDKALPSAPSGTLTFTGAGGTTLNGQYGSLVLNANGEYTYTPTVDLVTGGTDYFKYTMTDDGGLQSTATLAIHVLTSASGDPNAVADTGTATEAGTATGSPATGTLTTNDTAGTGANITVNPVTAAKLMSASSFTSIASGSYIDITGAYGTLRVYATGAYTYTVSDGNAQVNALNSGDTLTEVFQYQLTNSLSKVDTTSLTITLQGANDAPLAQADSFITPEDTALTINTSSLLGNDSDPDNVTLSVTGVSGASNCTVVLNGNGTITFTPAANFYGNASFTYTVADGSGGTSTATVTVAVVPVVDVPVAQANTYAANPSSLLTGLNVLTNTDTTAGLDTVDALFVNADLVIGKVNGSAFTANGTEANHLAADGWMQVALTNGTLYIKQDGTLNYYSATAGATDTFTYTAIDPSGAESGSATVTLNVSNSVDTDLDGVADLTDIDDDNDGIVDNNESTTNYQWASYPSGVSNASNTVSGVMAGINFTYTLTKLSDNSALNLKSTSSVFNHSLFPASFAIPNINPTIQNDVASINTLSFSSPILNPVLAFSSIGSPSNSVQIQFDRDVEVLWSTAVTVNSGSLVTGREGFMVVRLKGSISNFNFRYLNNEYYVNFAFGADIRQDLDTDTDGLVDRLDIDADNDGITDNIEAQTTASYIAPSGQGGSMVDVDDDGLDDNYDDDKVIATTTATTSKGLTPVNTDSDTKADYIDTDSDGDGMLDIAERHDTQATSVTAGTDTDSDGLLDIFEAGSASDGFDVNDNNYGSSVFNLARALTVQANGLNATPLTADMLYRTSTALSVNSITVNEGSPYAVFKVTGAPGQLMSLALGNTSATTDRDATLNTDTGNAGTSVPLQVNDGSGWVDYTPGSQVLISLTSTQLLVRTKITNDSTFESAETFTLVATHTNTAQVAGIATIKDDGTGDVFLATNTTDTPNSVTDSGYPANLDDDRSLSVNTINVNEGSPYAVFTVTANIGQTLTLALSNGTAINNSGNNSATDGSVDFGPALQYSTNGGTSWSNYTAGFAVPGSGSGTTSVLVRTAVINDTIYEDSQGFSLTASYTSGLARSAIGTATIQDDGTGEWFTGTSGTGSATAPSGSTLNDDRALSVNTVNVNEGSPYAVFTITANIGETLTLALNNGTAVNNTGSSTATDGSVDFGPALQYSTDGGSTWSTYTAGFAVPGAGTGTATVLARTAVINDTTYEDSHDFTLTAGYTSGLARSINGTATIQDDGTGQWFDGTGGTGSATAPSGSTLNDDRALSVNTVNVNEGSPYAVFTVTANIGETLTLALNNGTAVNNTGSSTATDGSVDFGPALQYSTDGGSTWSTYTAGFAVPGIGTGTSTVLVRTAIINDNNYEKAQDFTLTASYTSGASRNTLGTATIQDDGTGQWFDGTSGTGSNTALAGKQMDDDQPKPIILPTPPAPPVAGPPKAPEPPPAPPVTVIRPFNSAVQVLEGKLAPPSALPPSTIGDVLTNNAGFRIVAIENAPPGLTLNKGVTDQFVEQGTNNGKFSIPYDAFMHSKQDAVIKLQAKQANDAPLPSWATFDPQAGTFDVKPPPNFKGKVELKVIARDDDGREAVSIFRLFVGEEAPAEQKPQSRNSLSEKIRLAAKRANPAAIRVMQESAERKAPAAEPAQAG